MPEDQSKKETQIIPKRLELAQAIKLEKEERCKRCMGRIEAILKEENCLLVANVGFEEIANGKFGIISNPGIRAL